MIPQIIINQQLSGFPLSKEELAGNLSSAKEPADQILTILGIDELRIAFHNPWNLSCQEFLKQGGVHLLIHNSILGKR